jgi:hypothetical protein
VTRGWRPDEFWRVGPGKNGRVGQNETRPPPRMRWRGPCQAAPHRVCQLPGLPCTAGLPPVPATRQRPRIPGFFPRPGVSSEWCPFPIGEVFSTPSPSGPQEVRIIYFCSFLNPHDVHRMRAVIRTYLGLSTSLCTTRPQVTRRDLRATIIGIALCNRPVCNCRRRLSARQCDHQRPIA